MCARTVPTARRQRIDVACWSIKASTATTFHTQDERAAALVEMPTKCCWWRNPGLLSWRSRLYHPPRPRLQKNLSCLPTSSGGPSIGKDCLWCSSLQMVGETSVQATTTLKTRTLRSLHVIVCTLIGRSHLPDNPICRGRFADGGRLVFHFCSRLASAWLLFELFCTRRRGMLSCFMGLRSARQNFKLVLRFLSVLSDPFHHDSTRY